MSRRRMIGGFLLLAGILCAASPLLVDAPDDDTFLSMLRQKEAGGDWASEGALNAGGRTYAIQIVQKTTFNDQGRMESEVATLTATPRSGQTLIYRRSRTFKNGTATEVFFDTPTRSFKRGSGPQGRDPWSEQVLADNTPVLAHSGVRLAVHLIGAVVALCGVVILIIPNRKGAQATPVENR